MFEDYPTINRQNGIFWMSERPIPPRFFVEEPAELTIRLQSTRSGMSASWWAGAKARRVAVSQAPFNPIVRALVKNFWWEPPDTWDCPVELEYQDVMTDSRPDLIWQMGSTVTNWQATVIGGLPDYGKALLKVVKRYAKLWDPIQQGSLEYMGAAETYRYKKYAYLVEKTFRQGSGAKWVYNHLFMHHDGIATRVLNGVAYVMVTASDQVTILSPDHPDDPLFMPVVSGCVMLFRHPVPVGRGVD